MSQHLASLKPGDVLEVKGYIILLKNCHCYTVIYLTHLCLYFFALSGQLKSSDMPQIWKRNLAWWEININWFYASTGEKFYFWCLILLTFPKNCGCYFGLKILGAIVCLLSSKFVYNLLLDTFIMKHCHQNRRSWAFSF